MRKQWESLEHKHATAAWSNLGYGMFIHFGLYSVCGGVWDGKEVHRGYSEQILSHGEVPQRDYEALADTFSFPCFDADAIARLAKDSGMRYIVMVSKHHDGFCMFHTDTTDYCTTASASKRDPLMELSQACSRHGLGFGIYFSWIDWHYENALPISDHNSDPIPPDHMQYNLAQLAELLTNYGPVCELWMDMGAPTAEQSQAVYELAHALQPTIMVNGRVWNDYGDFLTMGDNLFPEHALDLPWQTPATIYHATWGYRSWQERSDMEKRIEDITHGLFATLDGGGNYLLNIGPAGDGSVVPFERDVLLQVGKNLQQRGDSLRQPMKSQQRIQKPDGQGVFLLQEGTPVYRYTGSEYYSFRPIVTGRKWNLQIPRKGEYTVECQAAAPLAHEQKLCLDIGDETIIFTFKNGKAHVPVAQAVTLEKGAQDVVLYTVGEARRRPELADLGFSLRLCPEDAR